MAAAMDDEEAEDRMEIPASSSYVFALWNLIIRPPRRRYDAAKLGPKEFRLWGCNVRRYDVTLRNPRGMKLQCSHFVPQFPRRGSQQQSEQQMSQPRPCVIYLHANASCRLEALPLVPRFLPLNISLFVFDFAGCGESEGEYISLGWFERDDLAVCIDYLRKSGKVSAIGLWGRSMGAVTALLHADRDPSIGGMVLDSPFSNLKQLATELAQSDYMTVKIPQWLLSGALALGRMRIKSLCDFDIEALAPDNHVDKSFIPAFFIAARNDDFIPPHHTRKLFDAYTGDKEFELVEGDHNAPRPLELNRKATSFFCRAFRIDEIPPVHLHNALFDQNGILPMDLNAPQAIPSVAQRDQMCRHLAEVGDSSTRLMRKIQAYAPLRLEGAMQLETPEAEAGYCICLSPQPTEWGGDERPPSVFFACVSARKITLERATEDGLEQLGTSACECEVCIPMLCVLEHKGESLRLTVGVEGPEISLDLSGEEFASEVLAWTVARKGDATFFDVAAVPITTNIRAPAPRDRSERSEVMDPRLDPYRCEAPPSLGADPPPDGGIPEPVAAGNRLRDRPRADSDENKSSGTCRTQ